ncbi:Uncharacterised protein [Photobacterium damselae]|nr:Uncharacterised protein [Photobacterium damselae]SUB66436.1 Uncharacterised protein [Photobacterium damselae]
MEFSLRLALLSTGVTFAYLVAFGLIALHA